MAEKNNKVTNLEELVKFFMLEPESSEETIESEIFEPDCVFEKNKGPIEELVCNNIELQKAAGVELIEEEVVKGK